MGGPRPLLVGPPPGRWSWVVQKAGWAATCDNPASPSASVPVESLPPLSFTMDCVGESFSVPPCPAEASKVITQRLIWICKCSASSSGLLLTSSYYVTRFCSSIYCTKACGLYLYPILYVLSSCSLTGWWLSHVSSSLLPRILCVSGHPTYTSCLTTDWSAVY